MKRYTQLIQDLQEEFNFEHEKLVRLNKMLATNPVEISSTQKFLLRLQGLSMTTTLEIFGKRISDLKAKNG